MIVPNYNDGLYIDRCLRSVISQDVPPDELIIVDDASTDDSLTRISKLLSGCAFATVIRNSKNLGVYGAVDNGLKYSSSEYVLFLSANDFVLPGILRRARESLANYPEVGLWSAMGWRVDELGHPLRVLPQAVVSLQEKYFTAKECSRLAWRFGNWFVGTSIIYRRATFDEIGRFDPIYCGLADLICALCVASKHGAVFVPEPLAVFRDHPDSFLMRTLQSPNTIAKALSHLSNYGPLRAPRLFVPSFLKRTKRRLLFSAIRASHGRSMTEYADVTSGISRNLLRLLLSITPENYLPALRVALAFLILRPFDLWPSFWNRHLGGAFVAVRSARSHKF